MNITKNLGTINTIDTIKVFAQVETNAFTNQKGLFATQFFNKGDVICSFYGGTITNTPTYLTVQIAIDKHITLEPDFLQFTNHSCEPNVFFNTTSFECVALKNINIGEEFCFFYPSTEWDMAQSFQCTCGHTNCIGEIKGAKYLNEQEIKNYRLTDFIISKLENK